MIPNQWYIILSSSELRRKPIRTKRLGEMLALWRNEDGKASCIADRCCHRGASLGIGKTKEGHLECPFHGFRYDSTGRVSQIPANGINTKVPDTMHVEAYKVHEAHGFIWIWWGDAEKCTTEPFYFEELDRFSSITFSDHWRVHYTRAIENQLDVVHLPFVHRTTIGRGNKTLVNGPVVETEGDLITFYVDNKRDDGQTLPLKPSEIKDYKNLFHLQFHFPNVWQNFISDKIRIVAAFVPIDNENTIVYIRYYQRMVRIPMLKQLFLWLGKVSSKIILRQDKRVVETQLPVSSEGNPNERLIMGDKPIIEYRKRRLELMK